MRSFAHWTPPYALARIRQEVHQRAHPRHPWLTTEAIGLLERLLRHDDSAVEFGAGRSTIWLAGHVRNLVSVEHDREWFERVGARVAATGLRNVELLHCPSRDGDADAANSRYVRVLDRFPETSLDVVLVDGIFRGECALAAIPKLRPGGIMIIDNVNWYLPSATHAPLSRSLAQGPADALWREFLDVTRAYRRIWTTNGVWDTLLLFKS